MLKNRSLLFTTISYAAIGYFQYLFFYWSQFYFDTILVLGKEKSRTYATILNLSMAVGMLLGGWLADRVQKQFGKRFGRAFVPMVGMVVSALFVLMGILTRDPDSVLLWFSLAMGAAGACEGPFWVTAIDLGGSKGGTSAAIFNTGGNAGGLLAPVVTPYFSRYYGWQSSIGLAGFFCLAGAALWFWIDPAERCKK